MNQNIEPYYNEDKTKIAVLVSPGWGAGWSTWNNKELAVDKRAVQFWLDHKNDIAWMSSVRNTDTAANLEAKAYFASIGYPQVYFGGFAKIIQVWVSTGTLFVIEEYDGSENVMLSSDFDWMVFY